MPRASRIVIPGIPHHVTQRGNRRQPIFFTNDDRETYKNLVSHYCGKFGTRCLAWCLMDNHVHLILVPSNADGLRATLAATHTVYSQRINAAQQTSGHLFQGRFTSYPMDDAHLYVAARYVENNPVKAGLVSRAEDWPWSSAQAHITARPDGLTDIASLGSWIDNWSAMLERGLEAANEAEGVERATRSGLPLADAQWREQLSTELGRRLTPLKPGPQRN